MKNLTVGSKVINSTVMFLIKNPGKWVGTETGKMVTRWDKELKFECENEDGSVWYTDNILEAVEWLYTDEDDSISLDMEDVEELIDKTEKRGKLEALEEIKDHHRRNASHFKRKSLQGINEHDSIVRQVEHEFSMGYIDRIIEKENL